MEMKRTFQEDEEREKSFGVSVTLDRTFWQKFLRLNKKAAHRVLNAFKEAKFTCAFISDDPSNGDMRRDRRHRRSALGLMMQHPYQQNRFRMLFRILGCHQSLTGLNVTYRDGIGLQLARAIKNVQQARTLWIEAEDMTVGPDFRKLLDGLRGHASTKTLSLRLPHGFYHQALSIIPTLRSLEKVQLNEYLSGTVVLSLDDAQALAQLLQLELPLEVKLHKVEFLEMGASLAFQEGVAAARVRGLELDESNLLLDPTRTMAVLASSRLKHVKITLTVDSASTRTELFHVTLGKSIASMTHLEEFNFCRSLGGDETVKNLEVAILKAAGSSTSLKRLTLTFDEYSESFDEACAQCIAQSTTLEEIDLHWRIHIFGRLICKAPMLVEAMKVNFRVQHIRLVDTFPLATVSWDEDTRANLDTFTLLNRSGRGYLASDPGNVIAGVQVLEKVADSLNCVFLHLRENPALCHEKCKRVGSSGGK
jgi:hypothetical protein